jgi:predicted DNA-binding antitoxin AbrB/MazE fold protein
MSEVIGVVEQGRIKLPESVRLPEGQSVRVLLDGAWDPDKPLPPLEDEEWTEEEMRMEIEQALGQRARP